MRMTTAMANIPNLRTEPYPQLKRIPHPGGVNKTAAHWGMQRQIMPGVVFGNSSTSAPLKSGGSNIRNYYSNGHGLSFLHTQYTSNNVYIYPEHKDHDPGPYGKNEGWGDVFPTNTPYLIGSQGSSSSDQPFMKALPYVLAAFRPEVKKKLIETGQLMPTIQMIFRSTNGHLKSPAEYLSGKAHPTIFEGDWVRPKAMIRKAHALTLDTLPPIIQLKVIEEDPTIPKVDFFEPAFVEQLADTPAVIARIYRGRAAQRRIVVTAKPSFDPNQKPLSYHWVVLRGDAERIQINPRNAEGSEVEIIIPWHPNAPVTPHSTLTSNRIDIGAFVHNGTHYSAPGFITSFSLANENRIYNEQGKLLERHFGQGDSVVEVKDWPALLNELQRNTKLLKQLNIDPIHQPKYVNAGNKYDQLTEQVDAAFKAFEVLMTKRKKIAKDSPDSSQLPTIDKEIKAARKIYDTARNARTKLTDSIHRHTVQPFQEQLDIARKHPKLLRIAIKHHYVDPRIARPKFWSDVYHYDDNDDCTGWTRTIQGEKQEYTADGKRIMKRSWRGKITETAEVDYRTDSKNAKPGTPTALIPVLR